VTRKPANIQAFQYYCNCWIQTNKTKFGGKRERKVETNKIERRKKNRGEEVNKKEKNVRKVILKRNKNET